METMGRRQLMGLLEALMGRAWMHKELEYLWRVVQTRKLWDRKEICIKAFKMASFTFQTTPTTPWPWISVFSVLIELHLWTLQVMVRWINKYLCSSEGDNRQLNKEKTATIKILPTRPPWVMALHLQPTYSLLILTQTQLEVEPINYRLVKTSIEVTKTIIIKHQTTIRNTQTKKASCVVLESLKRFKNITIQIQI